MFKERIKIIFAKIQKIKLLNNSNYSGKKLKDLCAILDEY